MKSDIKVNFFNDNAIAYDKFRPKYSNTLTQDLIKFSELNLNDKILEIGCGTGQLTIDFVKKGYNLVAIERGKNLAEIAKKNIKHFRNGEIVNEKFENWQSPSKFKLIVSAQAFHWIDKEIGIKKILSLIDKKGVLALVWHIDQSHNSRFWNETTSIYLKYFPEKYTKQKIGDISIGYQNYLNKVGKFERVKRIEYQWEKTYTKEQYLGLLTTFSDHMLEKEKRKKFFREIESVIELNENHVKKFYKTVLLWTKC